MSTTPPGPPLGRPLGPPAGTPPTGSGDDGALPGGGDAITSGDRPPVDAAAVLADEQVIEWLRAHHGGDSDTGEAVAPALSVGGAAGDPAITALLALLDDVSVVEPAPLAAVVPLRRHRTRRAIAAGVVALSTLSVGGVAAAAGEDHPLRPLRDAVTSAAGSVASSMLGSAVGAVIEAAVPGDQSPDSGRVDADPQAASAPPGAGPSGAVPPGNQSPGAAIPGAPNAAVPSAGPGAGPQTLPGTPPSGPLAGAPLGTSPDARSAPAPGDQGSSGSIAGPVPTQPTPGSTPRGAGPAATPLPTAQVDPTAPAGRGPTTERSGPVATARSTPTPEASSPRTSQGSDDRAARARALDSVNESLDEVSVALDKGQIDKAGRLLERAAVRVAALDGRDADRPRARLQQLRTRYAQMAAAASTPSTAAGNDNDKRKDDKRKDKDKDKDEDEDDDEDDRKGKDDKGREKKDKD